MPNLRRSLMLDITCYKMTHRMSPTLNVEHPSAKTYSGAIHGALRPQARRDLSAVLKRTFVQRISFGLVITVWTVIGRTRWWTSRPHRVLLYHGLRVASARCSAVLVWEVMVLLWGTILTLVQLWVRPSHWSHCRDVSCISRITSSVTYWILVAFGTSEELEHQVACTSWAAAECALVASPADSSLVHLAVDWGTHWHQDQAYGQGTEGRRGQERESTSAFAGRRACPCKARSKADSSSSGHPLLVLEG